MKILFTLATAGFAAANFLEPQTLAWTPIDSSILPYNESLSCGGCIRGGYTYCAEKGSKIGRGLNDVCCKDEACAIKAIEKNMDCGHNNPNFNFTANYYPDPFNLLQKFCSRRQDSVACCGNNGNNECKIKTKFKEDQEVKIDATKLTFGGSCTYKIEAKCGFPSVTLNSSDFDMVVAFKKNQNGVTPDEPDQSGSFDETANPAVKNGKIAFTMPKSAKEEDKNTTDESTCQMTKLYVTLTNLKDPLQPPKTLAAQEEVRMLQGVATGPVVLTYSAIEVKGDNALLASVTLAFSAIVLAIAYVF